MHGKPLVPAGTRLRRPAQLIATPPRRRRRPRRSCFNGHIDVVSAEPRGAWTSDPFAAEVRDGRLYGRGACDMKGGIAAMVFAAEVARGSSASRSTGDLLVATNTDEESSGAGGTALVERGLRADAGIVTEPTGFDAWVACRGSEYGVITVPGRPGPRRGAASPDWRDGGAVNAIEKAAVVLEAIASLRARVGAARRASTTRSCRRRRCCRRWRAPASGRSPIPASCELTIAVMYLPRRPTSAARGRRSAREVEEWIARESARDDWLAEHPPVIEWWPNGVMPIEISAVGADRRRRCSRRPPTSARPAARRPRLLVRRRDADRSSRGIPSIGYGPPGFDADGASVAHMIDEYVPVDGLVGCAQGARGRRDALLRPGLRASPRRAGRARRPCLPMSTR